MQQINLFQDVLRKPREFLPLPQLGKVMAGGVAVLLLLNLAQWWRDGYRADELVFLRAEQQQVQQQLQQLQQEIQSLAAQNDASALKTQLAARDAELQNKQQVLTLLSGKHFGNVDGFATQFTGLARQRLDGLWLTALHIHDGGNKLNLRGSTTAPELLPKYLQRLAVEPGFAGIEFKTFLMQRVKDKPHVEFDLRATPDEKVK